MVSRGSRRPGVVPRWWSLSFSFTRSGANWPVRDGRGLAISTLSAAVMWEVTWVSCVDPVPGPLPDEVIAVTAEVRVAEVETVVTAG